MIQAHCPDHSAADRLWRMLCHVPDADFQEIDVYVGDRFVYRVIRTANGDQSTAQPVTLPG
jgi:hypothetical protein